MSSDEATRAAKNIIEDRSGADFYGDNGRLADYLASTLGITEEQAAKAAGAINEDRRGANYYQNESTLAEYLSG